MRMILKKLLRLWRVKKSGWQGDYASWEDAEQLSKGYDAVEIAEKVLASTLKVKNGEAVFERDSVLFDKIEYSEPLILSLVLASNNKKLTVLDFGGALGSHYYQNVKFLKENAGINKVCWNIIEQAKYVEIGKQKIAGEELKFYSSIKEYQDINIKTDIVILSSVLAYLENAYEIIDDLLALGAKYLIIDRTLMVENMEDIICVQTVPESIYKASYPCRIFSKEKLIANLIKTEKYQVIMDYSSKIDSDVYIGTQVAESKGLLLKKIGE